MHLTNYIQMYTGKMSIYQMPKLCFTETTARLKRYHIILEHAVKYNYPCIVTGHTATDRIETFIYNIVRGSSINGITSLNHHRKIENNIHIYRPLVHINRAQINSICRQLYLPIWSDYTNYNQNITRNRVRNELMPYLKNYYNKNVEKHLIKFLNICYEDNEYISQNALKLYLQSRHKKFAAINHQMIVKEHITIQKRIIKLFFFHNFNIRLSNSENIRIIKYIKTHNSFTYLKHKKLFLKTNKIWLYFI